ncbi:fork head domain-containing protein, partial [Gilbertella persicaria]|uniref:fork head domain-containing protein n=1 Tax=Gilbertella persicaria TaxID=101096 RepID=UPI00221ECA1B
KPPFSYATLIAYAILSSKDGRLTLNGIYTWISHQYPFYSMRQGGWQNSIRHNLSLNKKWFFKIDRRPTQTNPGKGCYWTLIPGAESVFINKLTYEKSHYRKHHDIELTAELFKD